MILKLLDDFQKNYVFMIAVSGGDPLLHPDFFAILREIIKRKMMPLVGITGIQLTSSIINQFSSIEIPCIQVSLDGSSENKNSYYRGRNNFGEVLKSIEMLNHANIRTNLAICVDKNNLSDLKNILALARIKKCYKVKVSLWQPSQNVCDSKHSTLNLEEYDLVKKICAQFQTEHNLEGWINSPSFELDSVSIKSEYTQSLTVAANGEIRTSGHNNCIGSIYHESVSECYQKYLANRK